VTGTRLALLAGAGALLYGGAIAVVVTSDQAVTGTVVIAVAAGLAFTATALVALARRPENRTGPLMLAVGFLWALGALTLTRSSLLFTVGAVTQQLGFAPLTQLLLAYPSGVLGSRYHRRLVGAVWAVVFLGPLLISLVDRTPTDCTTCPRSAFVVRPSHALSLAAQIGYTVAAIGLALAALVELVRRYRDAGPPLRRVLSPVYAMFALALVFLVVSNGVGAFSDPAGTTLGAIAVVFIALVPVAFLAGLLRSRLARGSVLELLTALEGGTPLRDALRTGLGDPSLEIAYWLEGPGRWVDADGRETPQPVAGSGRSVTTVEHDGERVSALLHDASLDDAPELVRGVAAAAALSLQAQRAQAELHNQYELLSTLVDTAPSLLVTVDPDGRIRSHNSAALEASGADTEEIRGQYFWDVFIDPGERAAMLERFRAAAPEFAAAEYENAFTNRRGEPRVVFWRSAPVRDEEGRVVSIVAGGLDITERHRLQAEKELEREFLNAIANHASSLICLIDHEGRMTERGVNIAFERTLGWDDHDVGGRVLWEHWIDPGDADEVRARIERTVAGESLGEHDNLWITRGGERLAIAWTCAALPRIDDRRIFLITGVDVTERHRREEEIRAAEERFRAVVESAPVAIVEIGLDGNVNLWNPAAEQIFGWPAADVLGRPPVWVPPEKQNEFRELSAREATGSGYTSFETVRAHRDGRLIDVEISAAPIRDAAGAVVGAMAILGDISDRRRQEEEVRASRARIVQTADDTRRKLERNLHDGAQQRLVALSVSLRLAEAKLGSPDVGAAAAILAGAREELAHALEELRELARGIHPAVLTDRGLAAAVEALVARTPLPVELELSQDRLPPAVEAALYYVVAESLTNVVKYAGATSARVRLAVNGEGVVTAEVSDDGVGGADPATGSGLRGLVDRVEALDGRLVVHSPAGGGTRVRAEVPLAPAHRR
jgi:PAS domain S-box-containing protein